MTWADYRPIPGVNWADPALVPIEEAIPRRADRGRFPRPAVRHHAAQALATRSATRRSIRSARAGAAVLRRLLQHAGPAQSRPDHQRLLDGAVARPGRHRQDRRLRPVPHAEEALSVRPQRMGPEGRRSRRLHRRRPHGTRCRRAVARRRGRRQVQVRHRPAHLRRLRRDQRLAGIRRDEVPDQGGHSRRVGQSGHHQAALGGRRATCPGRVGRPARCSGASPACGRARAPARSRTRSCTSRSASATTTTIRTSQPYHRVGSGPWDIMDRGSFNGPGGPHRRWVVPAARARRCPPD